MTNAVLMGEKWFALVKGNWNIHVRNVSGKLYINIFVMILFLIILEKV